MSVGLVYKSVTRVLSFLITLVSKKLMLSLDHSAVNLIEWCDDSSSIESKIFLTSLFVGYLQMH